MATFELKNSLTEQTAADAVLHGAVKADQAGGQELGDLVPALVGGLIINVPRHSTLPAAPSRCGLPRETYAVAA